MNKEVYISEIEKMATTRSEEEKMRDNAMVAGGVGSTVVGGSLAKKELNTGSLDGLVRRYHNTKKKNVSSIKESGILSSKATDPNFNELTSQLGLPNKDMEGLTYLAKKRSLAESVGLARSRGKKMVVDLKDMKNHLKDNKTLKVNIPLDEYSKLNKGVNPELRGAKDWKEFKKNFIFMDDFSAQSLYKSLGEETDTIKGDIASRFIKGGKGYKKHSLGRIKKHIKSNPEIFAKGLKKVAPGVGLAGAGVGLAGYGVKRKLKDQMNQGK